MLPGIDELPVVKTLTDPFQWSDGSGRSTNFKDWSRRRAEIAREIEHYEIGEKPVVSKKDITADIVDDTLRVNVTVNGQTLTLKAKITYPAGKSPFPAIIGIGRGTGSLPSTIFTHSTSHKSCRTHKSAATSLSTNFILTVQTWEPIAPGPGE